VSLLPYSHSFVGDDYVPIEVARVAAKCVAETLDFERKICVGAEAQIDYASVGVPVAKDELTEVSIVGNQCPPLAEGDGEDLLVFQARWIINRNRGDVMSQVAKVGAEPGVDALV
jgi:hypothetical protein